MSCSNSSAILWRLVKIEIYSQIFAQMKLTQNLVFASFREPASEPADYENTHEIRTRKPNCLFFLFKTKTIVQETKKVECSTLKVKLE